jgi:hydroxyacylglutathione hydrolase
MTEGRVDEHGGEAPVKVRTIETPELGDRSYVVDDGSVAVVIDPQRDIDRIESLLAQTGIELGLVAETHIHNDYVTGGYELARRHGARYAVAAADRVKFEREPVSDGDRLQMGSLRIGVVATPGHTDTHLAYVVSDSSSEPGALFSGGSLLYGSVGRTDLVDPARTAELAAAQHRSARTLAALPGGTMVYPTHGFGSFCSGGQTLVREASTIAQERAHNDALTEPDEAAFVRRLVAGLGDYPAYYAHMAPRNRCGPAAPTLTPPPRLTSGEIAARLGAGEWIIDLRDRADYAAGHLVGTVGIELGRQFATYTGWLLPWGERLTLLADDPVQLADARRQLSRIGVDGVGEAVLAEVVAAAARGSYRRAGFADLAVILASPANSPDTPGVLVLDVRNDQERAESHLPGSRHIPLHQLTARVDELPTRQEIWVHCVSGYRASIAASLLERSGRLVVHVDDHLDQARSLGLLRAPA